MGMPDDSGRHAWEVHRLDGFFHLLDADAVVAQLAGLDEGIQAVEHLGQIERFGGRAMQLEQVDGVRVVGCAPSP